MCRHTVDSQGLDSHHWPSAEYKPGICLLHAMHSRAQDCYPQCLSRRLQQSLGGCRHQDLLKSNTGGDNQAGRLIIKAITNGKTTLIADHGTKQTIEELGAPNMLLPPLAGSRDDHLWAASKQRRDSQMTHLVSLHQRTGFK